MCALAHKLEERGFSTVVIASVRVQAEKTCPPRALWTSAMLGRPVGEPNDPPFQLRTIRAALALLLRTDGPVILEDFPDDPPGWPDNPNWVAPTTTQSDDFNNELTALLPRWQAAQTRCGRTSVGLGFQAPSEWPAFADAVLAGSLPTIPQLPTTALAVRFMCDDIKALYGEAAQATGPAPSANQVDTWFWRQTAAGALLRNLRQTAMASENNALKTVGGRFFVPTPWIV
ncbi:MAG TPA: hypothetical protein VHX39_14455 [Acetobacteraceae bacterium]|nr:hypothetical protein [Acetobacteraceae bacterium]